MQINNVAAPKEIPKKQLEEDDIPDGLIVGIKKELSRIDRRWGPREKKMQSAGNGRC